MARIQSVAWKLPYATSAAPPQQDIINKQVNCIHFFVLIVMGQLGEFKITHVASILFLLASAGL